MKKIIILSLFLSMTDAQANFLTEWFGAITSIDMEKSTKGFSFIPHRVKTQYSSRIIWGDGWSDHNESDPVMGVLVEAYGTGWLYSTVTDANGEFVVPVKAGSPFTIRASNGDDFATYSGTLSGVPRGTTKNDKD